VETGFISNPTEERLLKTPSYQEKLALAIKSGVITYLNDNPTDNTTFDKK
jgi:N-acetylmuramoyl-L-alanine amidase